MDPTIKARLQWVKLYVEKGNAGYVCRHCGISRPTLRKWVSRYQVYGIEGLKDRSRRPLHSPAKKVDHKVAEWIMDLRHKRNLGARRIQSELFREHQYRLSLAVIHKVLKQQGANPIKKLKRKKKFKRYNRPVPSDRIQIDTCKIASGIYQYTAIDDCSRWRILEIYKRRTAANTVDFIDKMVEEFPFPIQRIQSDRGREFLAVKAQQRMMYYGIKFRPIKPASPHLNGKVERSHKTDLEEFYATADLADFDKLREELGYWQFFYNWQRPHGSLGGKTPSQRVAELSNKTPIWDEVLELYDPQKEHIQEQNYQLEMQLRTLKPCL